MFEYELYTVQFKEHTSDPWGIQIRFENKECSVTVTKGLQAYRSGVKTGDILVKRNNEMLSDDTRIEIREKMRRGISCEVTLKRKITYKPGQHPSSIRWIFQKNSLR